MARQFLGDLTDGDAVDEIYLLADKQLRVNRNAQQYLLTTLRDRSGTLSGLMWNTSEERTGEFSAGEFVHVRGKVQLYQGTLQMILTHVRPVSPAGLDPADFHPDAGRDTAEMFDQLRTLLLTIDDPPLHALMECFLADEPLVDAFRRAPAGIKAHHAYPGGLLEHVLTILLTADRIIDLYPAVDRNLLFAGIFLHDLGKIREMSYDVNLAYTDEGQLLGHLVIGVELLTAKAAQTEQLTGQPFPVETLLRLKHMILSHHGTYEFGSPKLPMTPEAIALHHLDNLDAKVHEFARSIADDPNAESSWTPYSVRLGRKLYKGEPGE